MTAPQVCISIRQPWAWFIVNGWKPVENRTWPTRYRGPVLIHAAKGMTREEYASAVLMAVSRCGVPSSVIPSFLELERGGIVGQARVVGCVNQSDSPWFVGPYGHTLADASSLPFMPLKGRLSYFTVEASEVRP